jgi:hypothetical protein
MLKLYIFNINIMEFYSSDVIYPDKLTMDDRKEEDPQELSTVDVSQ